jgi:hypothetical protein
MPVFIVESEPEFHSRDHGGILRRPRHASHPLICCRWNCKSRMIRRRDTLENTFPRLVGPFRLPTWCRQSRQKMDYRVNKKSDQIFHAIESIICICINIPAILLVQSSSEPLGFENHSTQAQGDYIPFHRQLDQKNVG